MSQVTTEAPSHASEIAELEHESRLLRARNERLQAVIDGIVPRLASVCGANAMPPVMMARWLVEVGAVDPLKQKSPAEIIVGGTHVHMDAHMAPELAARYEAEVKRNQPKSCAAWAADGVLYDRSTTPQLLTDEQIDRITIEQWGDEASGVILQAHRAYARAILKAAQPRPLTQQQIDNMRDSLGWIVTGPMRDAYRQGIRDAESAHVIKGGASSDG